MKRLGILSLLITLCVALTLTACAAPRSVFEETVFTRSELYEATFNGFSLETDDYTVVIRDSVFAAQSDGGSALAAHIGDDVELIKSAFGSENMRRVTVIIDSATVAGGAYAVEDHAFCTADDVESGAYRPALVEAVLYAYEPYLAYGISEMLYNGECGDIIDDIHTDIFKLYAGCFCDAFSTPDEVRLAKAAARELIDFVYSAYGAPAVLDGISAEEKRAWADSVGLESELLETDEKPFACRYSRSKDYPLIVEFENIKLQIQYMEGEIETPRDVEEAILLTMNSIALYDAYIRENAPGIYADLFATWRSRSVFISTKPVTLFDGGGAASKDGLELTIEDVASIPHELVHSLFPIGNDADKWKYEGLAEYMSERVVQMDRAKSMYYDGLTQDTAGLDSLAVKAYEKCAAYYASRAPFPKTYAQVDISIACDTFAALTIKYPQARQLTKGLASTVDRRSQSSLTYIQAHSLMAYLIDEFSLETVLSFCMNKTDLQEAFGAEYDDVEREWHAALKMELLDG